MSKFCRTFEHTADIGLEASGRTLGELFEALAEGLAELICPREHVVARLRRTVQASAEDIEDLTVDFLNEIVLLTQADRFAIAWVEVRKLDAGSVLAEVAGEPFDPERHAIATEVKAVTYHQLQVAQRRDEWTARVILDI